MTKSNKDWGSEEISIEVDMMDSILVVYGKSSLCNP